MKLFRKKSIISRHRRMSESLNQASPNISYYSRRTDEELNTGRKIQRKEISKAVSFKHELWLRRSIMIFVLIVIIGAAFVLLRLSSKDQIGLMAADYSGLYVRNESEYQQAAQTLLQQSIWNHNKITVDTNNIAQKLISEFPELTNVDVSIPLVSNQPTVYVQVAQPALILSDPHGLYVLDSSGKVLVDNGSASAFAWLKLPQVMDESGLLLARGMQALPSTDISFIQTVTVQLSARKFSIASMVLPPATSELDVKLKGQPYIVKFNLANNDPRQQAGTFLATQANLHSQNITPTQYIDVRVDGRAYYQ